MSSPFAHYSEHLDELRRRLIVSFLAIAACSIVAYIFSEEIARFLVLPLSASQPAPVKLVYTNLTEAFISYLKISLLFGLICSFPILLYEAWMFIAPGLNKHEKKTAFTIVFWATMLFACGVGFAYFVVLPRVLGFFMGFSSPNLEPMPRLDAYLTFIARTSLAFGLAFEIPFLMVAAGKTALVEKGCFSRKRKYYYLAILLLSFLLSAGDLTASVLLVLPLFGLYEAGIFILQIFQ